MILNTTTLHMHVFQCNLWYSPRCVREGIPKRGCNQLSVIPDRSLVNQFMVLNWPPLLPVRKKQSCWSAPHIALTGLTDTSFKATGICLTCVVASSIKWNPWGIMTEFGAGQLGCYLRSISNSLTWEKSLYVCPKVYLNAQRLEKKY